MLCLSGHGVGFHLPVTVDDPLFGAGSNLDREPALGTQAVRLLLLQLKGLREVLLTDIKKDEALKIDIIDSPYSKNKYLKEMIYNRGF